MIPELVYTNSSIVDEINDISEAWDLLTQRPAWHADASCREHPEVDWFPEYGRPCRPALAICRGCLALEDCRSWALAQGSDLQGVWGGMSARERKRIRAQRRAAA